MGIPFNYHLGILGLEVKLGSWTVRRILYRDMEQVKTGYSLWNEHWTNVYPFGFLTIRRKSGLVRNFVINPPDRESFLKELERKIAKT